MSQKPKTNPEEVIVLVTADEISAFREELDMTREEFAKFIGVSLEDIERWEDRWRSTQNKAAPKVPLFYFLFFIFKN